MRAWVVVAVVVLWDVLFSLNLPVIQLVAANADKLPSNVMVGHPAGPFPWGWFIVQWGLGLVALASLLYAFWHRPRT